MPVSSSEISKASPAPKSKVSSRKPASFALLIDRHICMWGGGRLRIEEYTNPQSTFKPACSMSSSSSRSFSCPCLGCGFCLQSIQKHKSSTCWGIQAKAKTLDGVGHQYQVLPYPFIGASFVQLLGRAVANGPLDFRPSFVSEIVHVVHRCLTYRS